jgi:hypothetical protein
MKTMTLLKLGMLLAAGCMVPAAYGDGINFSLNLSPPAVVYPNTQPPVPLVETPSPVPGPGYVWINGSWGWGNDHHWTWDKGRWAVPPHPGMRYVPNQYSDRGHRHVFERGGWK